MSEGFEYRVVDIADLGTTVKTNVDDIENRLNEHGADGWECFGTLAGQGGAQLVFMKRPLSDGG